MPIQALREVLTPQLQIDCGTGYRPLTTLLPRRSAAGTWKATVYIPSNAVALSMNVVGGPMPFHLGPVQAAPILRVLLGARWSMPLVFSLLSRPKRIASMLRYLGQAWRIGGQARLREVVRLKMLTGPIVAPEGKLLAATLSPSHRYARWITEQKTHHYPAPALQSRRFSLLVPVGANDLPKLDATLAAIRLQTWRHWECRLGLASASDGTGFAALLRQTADTRISGTVLPTSERGAMLAALATSASGDLLLVLEPGDCLTAGALAALAMEVAADIVYGDEDRLGADRQREAPFLKPEWSPDLLYAFNYIGRPAALRRDLVEHVGGFTAGTAAAAEWDLHLRLTADPTIRVVRIPEILCHRDHDAQADRPTPLEPAAGDHRKAIADHWRRQGRDAVITTQPDGTQRSRVVAPLPASLSIILLDAWHPARLDACLRVLTGRVAGVSPQIIVVRAESDDVCICAQAASRHGATVVLTSEWSTRSAAYNTGARAASGTLLLFLDSTLEPTAPDWLDELVDFALRPGIGVVGPLHVDTAGTLLNAGFCLGTELCAPLFRGAALSDWGPIGSAMVPRTLTAVSGCLMVRRDVFARIGGFDETYAGVHGDVALCLAVRAAGWRVVHTPFALLVQHAPERTTVNLHRDLVRLAADIRRFGYEHDPFFHPALDSSQSIPQLRIGGGSNNATSLADSLRRHGGGLPSPCPLDLCNDTDVAAAIGKPTKHLLWPPQNPETIDDIWSAARWCLDLLRRRPELRRRFPDALSAGADGDFARWIAGTGELMLPRDAPGHIRAALSAGIGAQARHVVLIETRLAGDMEQAFLPSGRDRLFSFLLQRDGKALRPEEVWWLALECAEDPTRELARSYRFNPTWQAMFPDGLTVFGQHRFAAWFQAVHRSDAAWIDPARCSLWTDPADQLRLAWRARPSWQHRHPEACTTRPAALALLNWLMLPSTGLLEAAQVWLASQSVEALSNAMAKPGVNVVGHFCYPSGLRTSVTSVIAGLGEAGVAVAARDVPVDAVHDVPGHAAYDSFELYDTTLLHIQPEPLFEHAFHLAGQHARTPRSYRIVYWYWELEEAPESWLQAVAQVDEIWAATRFVANALRSRFDIPVLDLMPGVELPPFSRRPLAYFGIPAGHFAFLFAFHMTSGMERKNPLGLIRAFRTAFAAAEPVVLVIKISFGERYPDLLQQLRAAGGEQVMIIDQVFTTDETISLMDACHAYVSLHRSEGLGLTMAEAMLLAKPVIATGYSGNVDFMDATNSRLVDYRLVEIDQTIPPYSSGSRWAEPSEAHAACLMRDVWTHPAEAVALGQRARADVLANMSIRVAGERMASRLADIRTQIRL